MNVYEIVTERITAKLEQGVIPWRRPWHSESGLPRNLVSGKEYRGVNVFLLGCQGYPSPYWLTFKQAHELGGSVKKGAEGTPIIFWRWLEAQDLDPERGLPGTRRVPLLRYFTTFNVEQCEGVRHRRLLELVEDAPKPFTPIARAEAIVEAYPSPPSISHGNAQAFYRPADDTVSMPSREAFVDGRGLLQHAVS
jgi:antirestriction protein ArdC